MIFVNKDIILLNKEYCGDVAFVMKKSPLKMRDTLQPVPVAHRDASGCIKWRKSRLWIYFRGRNTQKWSAYCRVKS